MVSFLSCQATTDTEKPSGTAYFDIADYLEQEILSNCGDSILKKMSFESDQDSLLVNAADAKAELDFIKSYTINKSRLLGAYDIDSIDSTPLREISYSLREKKKHSVQSLTVFIDSVGNAVKVEMMVATEDAFRSEGLFVSLSSCAVKIHRQFKNTLAKSQNIRTEFYSM